MLSISLGDETDQPTCNKKKNINKAEGGPDFA